MLTTDQIVLLEPAKCNTYLIVNGNRSVLVDAGYKGSLNHFEKILREHGLQPPDIRLIIMTHTHYDHSYRLKELKEITGAKVVVHQNEAHCLEKGYCDLPKGTLWFSKILSALGRGILRSIGKFTPVRPDIIVENKFDLKEYNLNGYVLFTPGHTVGSMTIIIDGFGFVGDNMFGIFRNTVFPPFADDIQGMIKSWKVIMDTGCRHFCPGHGTAFGVEKIRKTMEKMKIAV